MGGEVAVAGSVVTQSLPDEMRGNRYLIMLFFFAVLSAQIPRD